MFSKLAYYLFIYPVSFLPLRIMYVFTDFFYLLLITVIPYRKKVVRKNLSHSFPNLSEKELRKIERHYYRHLSDLLAEGAKNMSISKEKLCKRFKVVNPEVVNDLYAQEKDVLLVSGHLNNWEWLITGQDLFFKHQAVGIGMPLSSKFWDKKFTERRSRFGMKVIHSQNVHQFFKQSKQKTATLVLADQSPGDSRKCYWMNFLHQETGVIFGPEMLANRYNQAVVYFNIKKQKRGHYLMTLQLITAAPRTLEYGEITEKFTHLLEKSIHEEPAHWLWSHKRWKRQVPKDLDQLKKEQRAKFIKRYR